MKKYVTIVLVFAMLAILTLTFSFYACSSKDNKNSVSNYKISNENALYNNSSNTETENSTSSNENITKKSNFIAPYVDMASWIDTSSEYSLNGAPNLAKFAQKTNQYLYSLGFIQLNQANPQNIIDGSPRWGWGGYYDLSEKGNDGYQYEGIKESIQGLKNIGGDVIVSFGGQLGSAPWKVTQNLDLLKQMYYEVIDCYKLTRIDLDIEESNQDATQNYINAQALKEVQDSTGVKITLTIPIMPNGWEQKQINVINAYLQAGLNIDLINSMTMCYYNQGLRAGEDYADASIRAIENAKNQIIQIYKSCNKTLTDEEAYSLLGATVAIGAESGNPDFTPELTQKLLNYCKSKNIRMMSFWNMERDAKLEKNSGIDKMFEHINVLSNFV